MKPQQIRSAIIKQFVQDHMFCPRCRISLDYRSSGLVEVLLNGEEHAPPKRQMVLCMPCAHVMHKGFLAKKMMQNGDDRARFRLSNWYDIFYEG